MDQNIFALGNRSIIRGCRQINPSILLFNIPIDIYHLQQVNRKRRQLYNNNIESRCNKKYFCNICRNMDHSIQVCDDIVFSFCLKQQFILPLKEEVDNAPETIKYDHKNNRCVRDI